MKARLKYPIFSFAPKGNMIYVFRKEELYTTTNTELLKKRKNYIVVDATGTKYVEKGAHKVKWQGIFGYCIRTQGRGASYEELQAFDRLPFKNKVVFTHKPYPELASACYIKGFEDAKEVGDLFTYPGWNGHKYYDQFDYVDWFNHP